MAGVPALDHLGAGELRGPASADGDVSLLRQVLRQTKVDDLDGEILSVFVGKHDVIWLQV